MIRLLGMLVVVLAVLAGIGYYRGWFHAESQNANGHDTVTLTVDKDKLAQDKAAVEQRVENPGHK
jgi:hypothetical protein